MGFSSPHLKTQPVIIQSVHQLLSGNFSSYFPLSLTFHSTVHIPSANVSRGSSCHSSTSSIACSASWKRLPLQSQANEANEAGSAHARAQRLQRLRRSEAHARAFLWTRSLFNCERSRDETHCKRLRSWISRGTQYHYHHLPSITLQTVANSYVLHEHNFTMVVLRFLSVRLPNVKEHLWHKVWDLLVWHLPSESSTPSLIHLPPPLRCISSRAPHQRSDP